MCGKPALFQETSDQSEKLGRIKSRLGKPDLPWPASYFNGLLFLAFNEFGRLAHEVLGFPIFGPDLLFHDLPEFGKQHLRLLLLA